MVPVPRRVTLSTVINPVRVNHLNMVLEDFDTSVQHFEGLFGALFLTDLPQTAWHACLLDIGRVIFEMFAPHEFFLHSRWGAHYFGVEYQADMEEVREVLAARGIRVARELGVAVHTDPRDGHGISFEFYEGFFHDNEQLTGGHMRPAEYWRDEHPLGLTGLFGYSVVSADLAQSIDFFTHLVAADALYDEGRDAAGAHAAGLQVADAVVELQAPTGGGPVRDHLERFGPGIRSTIFAVRDLDQAQAYFRERGVELVAGDGPDRLALPAERNLGVVFEFTEAAG